MKIDQLRKIIREEVRSAVKEELQDVLTEAVKIASTPTKMQPAPQPGNTSWSAPKVKAPKISGDPIMEMLRETQASMTREDANHIVGSGVHKPNFASMMSNQMVRENHGTPVGLDISKLDFVNKAKAVLDLANQKSKNKL